LANTSASQLADIILDGGREPEELIQSVIDEALASDEGSAALFRDLVEPLADRFEFQLVNSYAHIFARVIEAAIPELDAASILERFMRIRRPRKFAGNPESVQAVYVLSRITIGADIAITSRILRAMFVHFANAKIYFVGPRKNFELFEPEIGIELLEVPYKRTGNLRERLSVYPKLREAFSEPGALIVDPDSRLSQLGLLPLGEEDNYYFFETRSWWSDEEMPLGEMTERWIEQTFEVPLHVPIVAVEDRLEGFDVTVSLGVGENPEKAMPWPFEARLLQLLVDRGLSVLVDTGAGGDEAERVRRAISEVKPGETGSVTPYYGSFKEFATEIHASELFIGYDSAGAHAACALGVPGLLVFRGYPNERFMIRWIPWGDGELEVLDGEGLSVELALDRVQEAVEAVFSDEIDEDSLDEDGLDEEELDDDVDSDEHDDDEDEGPGTRR
jgi:ADP-heptose:LPS heptosyltransferase